VKLGLNLRGEYKLKVFKNRAPRRIFRSEGEAYKEDGKTAY
jgi:hypothetical protein